MKTIWKATVCIVAVLLSFSIYSCGDDDDDAVGSRDLLLGTWNGVYYLSQECYSGNKLTLIDTEEDNYTEVWTVTTMTENELVYELREKEKEDGTTYEYYEQHAFTR